MSGPLRTPHSRRPALIAASLILVAAVALAACHNDGRELRPPTFPLPPSTTAPPTTVSPDREGAPPAPTDIVAVPFQLVAPWPDGASIPARYTCDDLDVSPALSWGSLPPETVELALTLTDLTVGFTHWVMVGVDLTHTGLAEGEVPAGAFLLPNDFGDAAWNGPCPPDGEAAHTYLFTLHALNQQLEVADDAAADEVISLLNQTAISQSSVSGTYARGG